MSAPKDMLELAKSVLKNAYCQYSNFSVAASVRTDDGELFAGCNVENASYGLTVCAETSAICQMVAAGKKKIKEVMVLIPGDEVCPPCGRCRQVIFEFSEPNTKVHLCTTGGAYEVYTVDHLLPHAFSKHQLLE